MAAATPLRLLSTGELAQFQAGDFVAVANGGTGATTVVGAQTALSLLPGTNVQVFSTVLSGLAALVGTGMVAMTTATTFTPRTITGTAGNITVANGDGVAGAPTLNLGAVTQGAGAGLVKITLDAFGRVSGNTAVATADLTPLLGTTYLALAGGTMAGTLILAGDPASGLHAATKQYVDGIAAGMQWKASCRVLQSTNVTLVSGTPSVVDGVAVAANDRVLVTGQSTAAQNGIYTVTTVGTGANGTWTRATDADTSAKVMSGMTAWVDEGTTFADTAWTLITDGAIVLGTTTLSFTQTSGLGQVTAGNGLTKSGNTISVAFSTRIVNAAGLVDLQTLAIGGSGVGTFTKVTVDTFGRVTATATATPGDIGAQPATTALTNLSALAGTGLLVQTGGAANSGTFTERSIVAGGSATITITNGSGVAGNPTLELTSGVVAPGTYTSLTVDTFGRVTAGANPLVGQIAVSLTNNTGSTIGKLKALYKTTTADQIALAKADASTTQRFIGFAAAAINNGAAGTVITDGVAVGLTTDWDAVTGQTGGLTPGSVYYLSDVTAGTITTNPPSSDWRVPVGVAISTTQMLIAKLEPVQF